MSQLATESEKVELEEIMASWRESVRLRGVEQGMEQGIERGRVSTLQEAVQRSLRLKFGASADAFQPQIAALKSIAQLQAAFDQAVTITSLDQLQL